MNFNGLKRTLIVIFCSAMLLGGCQQNYGQRLLQAGLRSFERGEYGRCVVVLQKFMSTCSNKENNAIVYNTMGIAYQKLGQYENAVQSFEKCRQLNPSLVEPLYNLGILMLDSGNDSRAIMMFEKAALVNSRETLPLEYLGHLYGRRQQWDEARRVLTEAYRRSPRSVRVLTGLAIVELNQGNTDKAASSLLEALEINPHYPPAIYNLAVVNHRWLKNNDQAVAYYTDFLTLSTNMPYAAIAMQSIKELKSTAPADRPPSIPATAPSVPQTPETSFKPQIMPVMMTPAPTTMITTVVPPAPTARPVEPNVTPPQLSASDEALETARSLAIEGKKEAAAEMFLQSAADAERVHNVRLQEDVLREATTSCPDEARVHYSLGKLLVNRKQNDAAMKHFKQAVLFSTNWFDAQMMLAQTAIDQGEFDTALISLQQAVQTKPDNADALWSLARLYDRNLNLSPQAAQIYKQFEKRFPKDPRTKTARQRLKALRS